MRHPRVGTIQPNPVCTDWQKSHEFGSWKRASRNKNTYTCTTFKHDSFHKVFFECWFFPRARRYVAVWGRVTAWAAHPGSGNCRRSLGYALRVWMAPTSSEYCGPNSFEINIRSRYKWRITSHISRNLDGVEFECIWSWALKQILEKQWFTLLINPPISDNSLVLIPGQTSQSFGVQKKVQPKCKLFLRLWIHERVFASDNLAKRGSIPHEPLCRLCDQEHETASSCSTVPMPVASGTSWMTG